MSNVLTDEEINQFWFTLGGDFVSFARDIERAVLAKAVEQEPIYMWRIEDDGWMECNKEWFSAAISEGCEKRIVYARPAPQQAIPEWQPIETMPSDRVSVLVYCEGSESVGIAHKATSGEIVMPEPQAIGHDCLTHWMPLPAPPKV